jgi:ABC-type glycerol-3-phosphate transport system substrate-binding protein
MIQRSKDPITYYKGDFMKKNVLKSLLLLSVAAVSLVFSGCGDKETESTEVKDEYIYTGEFEKLKDIDIENGYVNAFYLDGDTIYALATEYDPETYDTLGNALYSINIDTKESTSVMLATEAEGEQSYIQNFKVLSNGEIKAIVDSYVINGTDYSETYYLASYDASGNLVSYTDLTEAVGSSTESYEYVQNAVFSEDGDTYLILSQSVCVVGEDGSLKAKISNNNYIQNIFVNKDGDVYVKQYSDTDMTYALYRVDMESKSLVKDDNLPGGDGDLIECEDGTYLILNDTGVFSYDVATKEKTALFNWVDVDTLSYSADNFIVNEDGSYSMLQMQYDDNDNYLEYATFRKGLRSEVEKEIVTLGTAHLDYTLKERIIDFNKSNTQYRVSVKVYGDGEDIDAGLTLLDTAINTKGEIDLIDLSQSSGKKYAKAGALADLYELLNNDATIKKEDLFENILSAWEYDGKLYQIAPAFTLRAAASSKSYVDSLGDWNVDKLIELRNTYPDSAFLEYGYQQSALDFALTGAMSDFVNTEEATCDFENEEFYKILEFAKSFPKEADYDKNTWEQIQSGDVLFTSLDIYDVQAIDIYNQLFDGGISIVGYPSKDGGVITVSGDMMLAISATSTHSEGAWAFISSLLTEDAMESYYYGLPLRISSFDEKMKDEMEVSTYVDENGVTQKVSKGAWSYEDIMIEYYGATQDEVDELKRVISSATGVVSVDEQITNIITEETQAFFEGQKSAEEVASVIQSRAKIYLAENK